MTAGRGPRAPADRQRGSGTVLVVGLMAAVILLAAAVGVLAGAQRARSAAQTAADLGSLAAATSVAVPEGVTLAPSAGGGVDACALAREVVTRNGAVLVRCTAGPDGVVDVATSVRRGPGTATATARAGPAAHSDRPP